LVQLAGEVALHRVGEYRLGGGEDLFALGGERGVSGAVWRVLRPCRLGAQAVGAFLADPDPPRDLCAGQSLPEQQPDHPPPLGGLQWPGHPPQPRRCLGQFPRQLTDRCSRLGRGEAVSDLPGGVARQVRDEPQQRDRLAAFGGAALPSLPTGFASAVRRLPPSASVTGRDGAAARRAAPG
jgi:hypothetical protein